MNRHKLSSIPANGSRGLTITRDGREQAVFVVRQGEELHCYRNICPHTGVNLDWVSDQFLDADGKFIQCATHGALFRIEDGFCVSGPCAGQKLMPVEVLITDDSFELLLP